MEYILVTGGAGYIGSHTAHKLHAQNYKTIVLDNLSTGFRWAVPQKSEFVHGDCGDKELVNSLIKKYSIKSVIHFAAFLSVEESVYKPEKYYYNNVVNSLNLIDVCVKNHVENFIFSSSSAIYGTVEKFPITEETIPKPTSPYGKTKLMVEEIIKDFHQVNPSFGYMMLRYFNVAGAKASGDLGQATEKATQLIKIASEVITGKRSHLKLYGTDYPTHDGTCIRDYIHVEDLADLHILALQNLKNKKISHILNCGYGKGFSVREIISTMKKVSGVDFKVEEVGRRAGDPATIYADNQKIKNILNWVPQYDDIDLICKSSYEWELFYEKNKQLFLDKTKI